MIILSLLIIFSSQAQYHLVADSRSFFYQMWFTDHHPNMCSIYPTERWLEHAGCLLSQDFSMDNISIWSSGHVMENYALHAIEDHIIDARNRLLGIDARMMIQPILDIILKISKTKEEGYWLEVVLCLLIQNF